MGQVPINGPSENDPRNWFLEKEELMGIQLISCKLAIVCSLDLTHWNEIIGSARYVFVEITTFHFSFFKLEQVQKRKYFIDDEEVE